MNLNTSVAISNGGRANLSKEAREGVVEIGLLLPSNRAEALLELAHARQESVGQLLRRLIDRELSDSSC